MLAPLPTWLAVLLPVLVVAEAVVAIGLRPRLRFRVHRWEVTDEAVFTRTGWLSRTWTLVPVSRIQTVDVTRGVVQQLFGLAKRRGADGVVPGHRAHPALDADVAARVGRRPRRRAELVRDEAT